MKKLLKIYDFNSDMQYFEMIAESFINGQFTQAKEQFATMPRQNRIAFLHAATLGSWQSGISDNNLTTLFHQEIQGKKHD